MKAKFRFQHTIVCISVSSTGLHRGSQSKCVEPNAGTGAAVLAIVRTRQLSKSATTAGVAV